MHQTVPKHCAIFQRHQQLGAEQNESHPTYQCQWHVTMSRCIECCADGMFDGACAVQANGRRDLIASKYAAIIALRLSHIAEWDECGHHGVAGTGLCIIIINPCKPWYGHTLRHRHRASPTGEAERRLITLSIFGVR
jgi:hypothetical protein